MQEYLELLKTTQVAAPTIEVMILLVLLTITLVFKATRVGLLSAFVFVFRWGYLFIHENFNRDERANFLYGYLLFGVMVAILTVISMMKQSESD